MNLPCLNTAQSPVFAALTFINSNLLFIQSISSYAFAATYVLQAIVWQMGTFFFWKQTLTERAGPTTKRKQSNTLYLTPLCYAWNESAQIEEGRGNKPEEVNVKYSYYFICFDSGLL